MISNDKPTAGDSDAGARRSSCREFFRPGSDLCLCHLPPIHASTNAGIQRKREVNNSPESNTFSPHTVMSAVNNQRKAEILAKKAKLAELKRQRELRQKEFTQSRASTGDASEVCTVALSLVTLLTGLGIDT